jgi:hypothetical protein
MPREPRSTEEDVTMDGDGHTAKVFAWTGDEGAGAPAFDPAAVLRAIEEEDDDEDTETLAASPADDAADFGAALRAALAYEAEPSDPEPGVAAGAGEDEPVAVVEMADDEAESVEAYSGFEDGDAEEAEGHTAGFEDGASDDWVSETVEDDSDFDAAADVEAEDEDPDVDASAPFAPDDDVHGGAHSLEGADPEDGDMADDWTLAEADEDEHEDAAPAAFGRYPTMDELDAPGRKPRIALMGEFSAGKSTLSNLLIGAEPLPMKVTATQLPPVWISWGDGAPYREDLHGETHLIDIARLSEIDPAETRMIRIFQKSDVLEACDIIDMPGISDPNMASEVWERVIGRADGVIWCTHATQAWRQTEASVWETLDPGLFAKSLLLITRFDKLLTEADRTRVMRRVERETEGLFSARLPISLTRALAAGDDPELLERSGAAAFHARFREILDRLGDEIGTTARPDRTRETLARDGLVKPLAAARPDAGATAGRVLPRRVRPLSQMSPARG